MTNAIHNSAAGLPALLSEADLAHRWKVSKRTLQRWRNESRLPTAIRIGRKVLFTIDEVLAFERAASDRSAAE